MSMPLDPNQIVNIYKPALVLEEAYPRATRMRVRLLLSALTAIGIVGIFLLPETFIFVALAVVFILLVVHLLLEAMVHSYEFEGMERILPELGFPAVTNTVPIEVAEIYWKGKGHLTHGLLRSRVSARLWRRLEIDPTSISLEQVDGARLRGQLPSSLSELVSYTIGSDKKFDKLLFEKGVTKEALIETAQWVEEEIALEKEKRRKWGRDALGRIPALGTDWSNARAHTLEQFGTFVRESHYYTHSSSDVREVEREVEAVESVLAREKEANVLLLSDDTERALTLMGRLQRHIDKGRVLSPLERSKIFIFEARQAVAAAGGKEEIEMLLLTAFNEVAKSRNLILCIPSFSAFYSSAKAAGVDVLSLLEKHLASAAVRVIAVESADEYHRELSNHPVVRQLFEVLHSDFNAEAVESLLMRSIIEYEHHYDAFFTYPALKELSRALPRFFSDSILSDAVDDLLGELIPYAFNRGEHMVTKDLVDAFLEQKTGIPREGGVEESQVLLSLEEEMSEHVVGQESALKAVSKALRRARSGVRGGRRPMGSFLFLGPTGVGKTETAKTLARVFFGSENAMVRFDMSEFQGVEAVARLIGDASGRAGILAQRLRENPYSLILLDEFEKTSDEAKDLFLQIFDEGVFRDRSGRSVSATDAIFIATSNAASDIIWSFFKNNEDPAAHTPEVIDAVVSEHAFKPELINRFDGVVVFRPLSRNDLREIAKIMLSDLKERLYEERAIDVTFASDVIDFLVSNGYDPKFGARPMRRLIQDTIEDVLAEKILQNQAGSGSRLELSAADLPYE